jgi:hypothetical protein
VEGVHWLAAVQQNTVVRRKIPPDYEELISKT